jgi:enoyl-CoA hydratase/carnithine racemase
MGAELAAHYEAIESRPDINVAVITGAGDTAFSSGGYIPGYVMKDLLGAKGQGFTERLPKPDGRKVYIAAINGHCLAGGFGLALACDIRIAASGVKMGPSALKLGVVPGAQQTARLVRLVPFAKALEILLMAKYVSAEDAERCGLVNAVVPPGELMATATSWAETIAAFSPLAVQETKQLAYRGADRSLEDALQLEREVFLASTMTEDALEGFTAWTEKRKPVFKGR